MNWTSKNSIKSKTTPYFLKFSRETRGRFPVVRKWRRVSPNETRDAVNGKAKYVRRASQRLSRSKLRHGRNYRDSLPADVSFPALICGRVFHTVI